MDEWADGFANEIAVHLDQVKENSKRVVFQLGMGKSQWLDISEDEYNEYVQGGARLTRKLFTA